MPYGFDMLLYVRPMLATILPQPLGLSSERSVHATPRWVFKGKRGCHEFGMSN